MGENIGVHAARHPKAGAEGSPPQVLSCCEEGKDHDKPDTENDQDSLPLMAGEFVILAKETGGPKGGGQRTIIRLTLGKSGSGGICKPGGVDGA